GFVGAALLVAESPWTFSPRHATGYVLALAGAIIWSTYSLLTKRFGGFPTRAVAVFCFVSGVLALACHALFEPPYVVRALYVPSFLFIGLGPMAAAFYLWDRALKRGDPRVIGTLAYMTPLLSTLCIALLGEGRLTTLSLAAMGLIVGGAAIGTRVE